MEKHIKKNDRFKCKKTIKADGKEMYTKGKIYTCDKDSENPEDHYNQCIPYNDETKHLLGTTDDCHKKYKTW